MPNPPPPHPWHPALTGVSLLLVDFDGPLVRLLPDPEHVRLTARLAQWYADRGGQPPATTDHVQLLRHVHAHHPDLAADAEHLMTEAELAAAAAHSAYADAIGFLSDWQAAGGHVAIVSNNAEEAVRRVLTRSGLGTDGTWTVHARRPGGIARLKPAPDLLLEAMTAHAATPDGAVMIGDTPSDVRAGSAAGVRTIGVTDSADQAQALHTAGAATMIRRLVDLSMTDTPGG
ncbi:HAD family hydrolase [Ammonicoccus fulvus]|uniref:HAD family hydrolase n=1 Tax=Ammonicoccus fulvus TaxID=3138240 RepID=A0ABZ3FVS3_9ACTN